MRYIDGMLPDRAFKKSLFKSAPQTLEGGSAPQQAAQPSQQTITNNPIADWAQPTASALIGSQMQNAFNIDANGNILSSRGFTPFGGQTNAQGQFTGSPISQDQYNQQLQVAGLGVAGPSDLQQQSYQGAANLQTPGQFGQATQMAGYGTASALGAGQNFQNMATDPNAVQAYMNPYLQASLDPQLAEIQRQYGITGTQQAGQATQSGAFGGGRDAIMAAENERNKNTAMNTAIGQGYNTAFNNAQSQMNTGAQLGLQGAQAGIQGAGQLGQLGTQQLAAQQGILGTQNQMGSQEQQNQQNVINQALQNYGNQQNYGTTQATNIMNLVRSTPTTQTQTMYQAPPSLTSQAAGIGTAGIAGYKLATMAGGGIAKVKKFDVGGSVENQLYKMPDAALAEELKITPSQTIKTTGNAILKERQLGTTPTPAYAPGGIVAFAEGGESDIIPVEVPEEEDMIGNPMDEFTMPSYIMAVSKAPQQEKKTEHLSVPKGEKDFYNFMQNNIREVAHKMGVKNPDAIAHLGAAQSAIETGYGKHAPDNNFFGIKGAGQKQVTQEYVPGKGMVTVTDSFRGYATPEESIKDYIKFLSTNPRYENVLAAETPMEAIQAQHKTGYATDPKYGQKLTSIYQQNVQGKAEGGSIKHFQVGGLGVEDLRQGFSSEDVPAINQEDSLNAKRNVEEKGIKKSTKTPKITNIPNTLYEDPYGGALNEFNRNPAPEITKSEINANLQNRPTLQEIIRGVRAPQAAASKGSNFTPEYRAPSTGLKGMGIANGLDDVNTYIGMPNTGGIADINYYNLLNTEIQKYPNDKNLLEEKQKLIQRFPNLVTQNKLANQPTVAQAIPKTGMSDADYAKYKAMNDTSGERRFAQSQVKPSVAPTSQPTATPDYTNDVPYSSDAASQPLSSAPENQPQENQDSGGKSSRDMIQQMLMDRMSKQGESAQQDKWMSLLSAGLGMMGGTSPYAATNIGQGAQQGIAAQMAAKRNQISEQNSTLTGMLGLERAHATDAYHQAQLAQNAQIRKDQLNEVIRSHTATEEEKRNALAELTRGHNIQDQNTDEARADRKRQFNMQVLGNMEKNAQAQVLSELKLNPMALMGKSAEEINALTAPRIQEILKGNKRYRDMYKTTYDGYDPFETTETPVNKNLDLNKYLKK